MRIRFWLLTFILVIVGAGILGKYFLSGKNEASVVALGHELLNANPNLKWTAPDIEGGDHNLRPGYPLYIGKLDNLIAPPIQAEMSGQNPAYNCVFDRPATIDDNTYGDLINENLAFASVAECPNKIIGVQIWSSWAGRPTHNENFDQQKLTYSIRITKTSNGQTVVNENHEIMNKPAEDGVLGVYYYYQMPPGDSYRVTATSIMRQNGCNNGSDSTIAEATYTGQGITPSPTAIPTNSPTPSPRPSNTPTPSPRPTNTPTIRPTATLTPRPTATPTLVPTADDPSDEPPTPTPTH